MKIKKVDKAKKGMFRQYRAALKESKQSIKTKNSSIKMSIRNCVCTWKLGKQGIDGSHMKCRNEVFQFGKKKISVLLVLQLTQYPSEKAVGEAQQESCPDRSANSTPCDRRGLWRFRSQFTRSASSRISM